jgi:hypothetical protein
MNLTTTGVDSRHVVQASENRTRPFTECTASKATSSRTGIHRTAKSSQILYHADSAQCEPAV